MRWDFEVFFFPSLVGLNRKPFRKSTTLPPISNLRSTAHNWTVASLFLFSRHYFRFCSSTSRFANIDRNIDPCSQPKHEVRRYSLCSDFAKSLNTLPTVELLCCYYYYCIILLYCVTICHFFSYYQLVIFHPLKAG